MSKLILMGGFLLLPLITIGAENQRVLTESQVNQLVSDYNQDLSVKSQNQFLRLRANPSDEKFLKSLLTPEVANKKLPALEKVGAWTIEFQSNPKVRVEFQKDSKMKINGHVVDFPSGRSLKETFAYIERLATQKKTSWFEVLFLKTAFAQEKIDIPFAISYGISRLHYSLGYQYDDYDTFYDSPSPTGITEVEKQSRKIEKDNYFGAFRQLLAIENTAKVEIQCNSNGADPNPNDDSSLQSHVDVLTITREDGSVVKVTTRSDFSGTQYFRTIASQTQANVRSVAGTMEITDQEPVNVNFSAKELNRNPKEEIKKVPDATLLSKATAQCCLKLSRTLKGKNCFDVWKTRFLNQDVLPKERETVSGAIQDGTK